MHADIVTTIRALVLDDFEAAHPGVPLVFDNEPFDWNNLPDEFIEFEVKFYSGDQIGISFNPKTRVGGCVYATAYVREGRGALASLRYLETLASTLGYASPGAVRLQSPEIVDEGAPPKGWFTSALKVAFYADQS